MAQSMASSVPAVALDLRPNHIPTASSYYPFPTPLTLCKFPSWRKPLAGGEDQTLFIQNLIL